MAPSARSRTLEPAVYYGRRLCGRSVAMSPMLQAIFCLALAFDFSGVAFVLSSPWLLSPPPFPSPGKTTYTTLYTEKREEKRLLKYFRYRRASHSARSGTHLDWNPFSESPAGISTTQRLCIFKGQLLSQIYYGTLLKQVGH